MDPYGPPIPLSHHHDDSYRRPKRRYRRKISALFTLVLLGCAIIFFAIVLIACAFVVNYGDDFEVSTYGGIEEAVQSSFHYSQYWAGIPYLVTGVLIICSGTFQRHRELTITAAIFCVISIGITLFVVALDGPNWRDWDAASRRKSYWEGQDGVTCANQNEQCICTTSTTTTTGNTTSTTLTTVALMPHECDEAGNLASLYGAIVGCAILITLICAISVLTITKTLSWKRIIGRKRRHVYYDYDGAYADHGQANAVAMQPPRMHSRPPSFVDLPYTKRGEYIEEPVTASQLPPRQYSYRSYRSGSRGY